eukprot:CAMPEP_0198124712 /NCGR_PEP_ID=MMETSP1442-20131203/40682_1 /TAXON_ID= /ORGANISM="Craspedostauros australis, Strain CCMP3328" /LENGTH=233 /DNA_ID=CAMNT_0043784175 /DNA_START=243 /DNA_END=947 /DNA_ORIENTATION=+
MAMTRRASSAALLMSLLLVMHYAIQTSAFQMNKPMQYRTDISATPTRLQAKQNPLFEYQELMVQFRAMEQQEVPFSSLRQDKQQELEKYIQTLILKKNARVDYSQLFQKSWKLIYSTSTVSLPVATSTTAYIDFLSDDKLNYRLEFGKFGLLKRMVASCTYELEAATNTLQYRYDKIASDAMGMKNINIGFMLEGRVSTIQTVYLDDQLWIDRGYEGPDGKEYVNVYVPAASD